jgi:hypothetical protein
MHTTGFQARRWLRAGVVMGALVAAGSLAACKDFLTADNPAAVPVERLEDTALVELMHNSAIGALQGHSAPNTNTYFWLTYLSAIFTDELRNHHVFFEEGLFDQRRVTVDNIYNSVFTYSPLQRGRWLADSIAGRMRTIYGDSALRDVRLARTYAMAGYTLVMLGEMWCEVPLSTGAEKYSRPYTSAELFGFAEARFDSALKIAAASRAANVAAGPAANRFVLTADSIRNLALVGMARAALNRGDDAKAIANAQLVTGMGTANDFEYRLHYNSNTVLGIANLYQERLSGSAGERVGSVTGTPFFNLDDARVPHPRDATGLPLTEATQNGLQALVPNSSPSHSTYNGTKTGADFSYGGSIRLASRLEAQYILAEAGGAAGANLGGQSNIAFVESRRTAFPSTTAATPTDAATYGANLRDQRRRDFYLDGHRMGDLRRYLRRYQVDDWQKGSFYGSTTVSFANQMCWPLTVAEITNNPLVPKPYTPPNGP